MAEQNIESIIIYSDVNNSPLNNTTLVINEQAVFQAFDNLFNTKKKSRMWRPTLDPEFSKLLFEPVTKEIATLMLSVIIDRIQQYDSRIVFDMTQTFIVPYPAGDISGNNVGAGAYDAKFIFGIRGLSGQYEYKGQLDSLFSL